MTSVAHQRTGNVKLRVDGLSKHFVTRGGVVPVLEDISFDLYSNEIVTVVGASGCGKTTLLRIIDGLESPSSGSVWLDGGRLVGPGENRGFVFQHDTLLPWRTVLNNVTFGLELQGMKRKEAEAEAKSYLELVGLRDCGGMYPHQISGGMRQRANLARAMAIRPELLLMDEPFASLDAQTRELMQAELLRMWAGAAGASIIFITHQIDEAVYLGDRVIVMSARPGRIREIIDVEFARPRKLGIKREPAFTKVVDHIWNSIEQEVKAGMVAPS